jgi:4-aminobutyrate aminotransferase-like enzyme
MADLPAIRQICDEHGILLLSENVQSGTGPAGIGLHKTW